MEKEAFRTLAQKLVDEWHTSRSRSHTNRPVLARILLLAWQFLRIGDLLQARINHKCLIEDNNFAVLLYRLMREPRMTANQLHEFKIASITLPQVLDLEVRCVYRLISSISK